MTLTDREQSILVALAIAEPVLCVTLIVIIAAVERFKK
jgi:hypothetical protein